MVKGPPSPFDPATIVLPAGDLLYRVVTATRSATEFNPGQGAPTRFAFFGNPAVQRGSTEERRSWDRRINPVVPVMYAADTEMAAVAETLLHNIPVDGGVVPFDRYSNKALVRLAVTRDLRLAVLHGLGLRRLKVVADDVTSSPASTYPTTMRWAEAAHQIGLDGLVWMPRMCNDAKAYVFFGDHCADAFTQDVSHARIFASPADQIWLIDRCAPLHVDVLLEPR